MENHLKNFSFSSRTLRNEIPFSFSSRSWRIFFQISLSLLDWLFLPLVAQWWRTVNYINTSARKIKTVWREKRRKKCEEAFSTELKSWEAQDLLLKGEDSIYKKNSQKKTHYELNNERVESEKKSIITKGSHLRQNITYWKTLVSISLQRRPVNDPYKRPRWARIKMASVTILWWLVKIEQSAINHNHSQSITINDNQWQSANIRNQWSP